jgi:lipoprotein-anchoring transpeptidase ErfK/SrfK
VSTDGSSRQLPSRALLVGALAVIVGVAVAVAAAGSSGPAESPSATRPRPPAPSGHLVTHTATATGSSPSVLATPSATDAGSLVATAVVSSVAAHGRRDGAVTSTWTNPQRRGVPRTFRVMADRGEWLEVQLPQRPNGSTGWIRASDVALTRVTYRLLVSTERNRLTLFDGNRPMRTFVVATGTGGTPTPHGSFYLTELLSPTNSGYGPYAFGLSAFSEALSSFGGGPGQIGLHGTDDSASIGHAASHGCIRMANRDITTLARMLPLGTPVTIQ